MMDPKDMLAICAVLSVLFSILYYFIKKIASNKDHLIKTLNDLKDSIEKSDEKKIKDIIDRFHEDLVGNTQLLAELDTCGSKCTTQADLILAACRTRKTDTLYKLLKEYDILDHLPGADFDDPDVKVQITEAFKVALVMETFDMVELLYGYWCGDLHWNVQRVSPQSNETPQIIKKIKTLGELLNSARQVCKVEDQHRLIDIQSLITFNTFQNKLYSSLAKLVYSITPEYTATMLLKVLSIYEEYSDFEKVRIPNSNAAVDLQIKQSLNDKNNWCIKWEFNILYEVYYRNLDFNVALLIIENYLDLRNHLKQRFNKSTQYFMDNPGVKDKYIDAVSLYKEIESALFHYIYRTFEDWRLYLPRNRPLSEISHTGSDNGQNIVIKLKYDEEKTSKAPLLFLERDIFTKSLNNLKIILNEHVLEPQSAPAKGKSKGSSNKIELLLDDNYLSENMYMSDYYSLKKIVYYIGVIESTNGINVLMIERTLQVIGEMLKNTKHSSHVMESTKSLLHIAVSVETIEYVHDIREFLSHANKGSLSRRINIANNEKQIFVEIKEDLKVIKEIINLVIDINKNLIDKSLLEKGLYLLDEQIKNCHGTGLKSAGTACTKEIDCINENRKDIKSKIELVETIISKQVVRILPQTIRNIRQTLKLITDNENLVNQINEQLRQSYTKYLLIGDHGENIKLIKDAVAKNLVTLNKIKDVSSHWDHITKMLSFCLNDCHLFTLGDPIHHINVNDKDNIEEILVKLEGKCTSVLLYNNHTFSGIEKLHHIFEETQAPGFSTTARNDREQGQRVRQDLLECLISRVKLLKETLGYAQHIPTTDITLLSQYLRRYKSDKKFRLEIEMIMADIGNVFVACKIDKLMIKPVKLLRGIDLRDLLHHGNPFIEVIGDVWDSYDLPKELLSKAFMFVEDGELIEDLFNLFQNMITIKKHEKTIIKTRKKALKTKYKNHDRWDSYFQLINV